jgi:hypothetical protein
MNRNLGQFIVQSNQEATTGVAPPADVAPQEAVAARRPRQPVGVGRRAEKEKGAGRRWRTPVRSLSPAVVTAKRVRRVACRDFSFPLNFSALSWIVKYIYIFLVILHDISNLLICLALF